MGQTYSELYEAFRWHVPKGFNLAQACCLQWADLPGHERRPAVIEGNVNGTTGVTTFADLRAKSSQLAHGLTRLGVIPGDRVIIILSQADDTMAALLACWAIRAVAVPLDPKLDVDALVAKLRHARGQITLIDAQTQTEALAAIARCPRIKHVIGKDVYDARVMGWHGLLARQPNTFTPYDSLPSDRALLSWPRVPLLDQPGAALMMAHQSLIGQLPGFVMATNWFPEQANCLLTTFKPWEDAGLLAAILPALYFGHAVMFTDKVPLPADLPPAVTHVITTSDPLIETLNQCSQDDAPAKTLKAIVVIDHVLELAWRERAQATYGVQPNLANFFDGSGLMLAQCQERWSDSALTSGRLVPGHQLRICDADNVVIDVPDQIGQIQVARIDQAGATDPAQHIQTWPLKETLDVNAVLPDWSNTGIYAKRHPNGLWQVYGTCTEHQRINSCVFSIRALEQRLRAIDHIGWAQVAIVAARKSAPNDLEIWALIDAGLTVERQLKPWRDALRDEVRRVVATAVPNLDQINVRVGLVDHLALSNTDRLARLAWQTRACQALIDFL